MYYSTAIMKVAASTTEPRVHVGQTGKVGHHYVRVQRTRIVPSPKVVTAQVSLSAQSEACVHRRRCLELITHVTDADGTLTVGCIGTERYLAVAVVKCEVAQYKAVREWALFSGNMTICERCAVASEVISSRRARSMPRKDLIFILDLSQFGPPAGVEWEIAFPYSHSASHYHGGALSIESISPGSGRLRSWLRPVRKYRTIDPLCEGSRTYNLNCGSMR